MNKTTNIETKITDKSNFWVQDDFGMIWHIQEGTGDNLLQEDINVGYVDYIYYDYYEDIQSINDDSNYDGGMYLLKKPYDEYTIEEILKLLEDFEGVKFKGVK